MSYATKEGAWISATKEGAWISATKEGAWISATEVTRVDCTKCGTVLTSKWPCNDREAYELIREHARKHGGIDSGY